MRTTFETGQPWVVYSYPRTDEEAERVGAGLVRMLCAICGEEKDCELQFGGEEEKRSREPGYRHPVRLAFLDAHKHPFQVSAPETWSLPLLNPAAHGDTMDILRDVAAKAKHSRRHSAEDSEGDQ